MTVELEDYQARFIATALAGEQMADGCVRGCPVRNNKNTAHNFRCADVRAARVLVVTALNKQRKEKP